MGALTVLVRRMLTALPCARPLKQPLDNVTSTAPSPAPFPLHHPQLPLLIPVIPGRQSPSSGLNLEPSSLGLRRLSSGTKFLESAPPHCHAPRVPVPPSPWVPRTPKSPRYPPADRRSATLSRQSVTRRLTSMRMTRFTRNTRRTPRTSPPMTTSWRWPLLARPDVLRCSHVTMIITVWASLETSLRRCT